MTNHTISTAITSPVVLGSSQYGTVLTITATGSVVLAQTNQYENAISGGMGLGTISLLNEGVVVGGYSGGASYRAGAGIYLASAAVITNKGAITGGYSSAYADGGAGISLVAAGTVHNTGQIAGGLSVGGLGGVGVDLAASGTLTNTGRVTGGDSVATFSAGGAGVVLGAPSSGHAGEISNSGNIAGGSAFGGASVYNYVGSGGAGISLLAGSVTNTGHVSGGNGAYSYRGGASNGGAGVDIAAGGGGVLVNHGTIAGGNAGGGHVGGVGTAGCGVVDTGLVVNTGTIVGGSGAAGHGVYGANAAGVYLNGGALVAKAGLIEGGQAHGTPQADAVKFGSSDSTLTVYGAARFSGAIAADAAAKDTLILAGNSGTLSGLGSSVNGFNDYVEDAKADWTLNGAVTGSGTFQLVGRDILHLNGASVIPTIDFSINSTVVLGLPDAVSSVFGTFGEGDTIQLLGITAHSLSYANGTLTLLGGSDKVVDKLFFSGTYSLADFKLQAIGGGTEVLYAGTAADHSPVHFGAPETIGHAALSDMVSGAESWLAALHSSLK